MIQAILADWQAFWFRPSQPKQLILPRVLTCLAAALWYFSLFPELSYWFGEVGVLPTQLAALFIEYEQLARWQFWSPLWWTDSLITVQSFVLAGGILSLLAMLGVGGRWTFVVLTLWTIALSHRLTWLIGPTEPALVAFLVYFAIQPGPSIVRREATTAELASSHELTDQSLATTSMRLLQTHAWILIAASLLMQLASLLWWRGESVWWLAAAGRSTVLSVDALVDHPFVVNGLTHGLVVVEMLALWLLVIKSTRWLGLCFACLTCFAFMLLADYWLYGLVLLSALSAYVPWQTTSKST